MLKTMLQSHLCQWLIVLLVAVYVMVVRATCKWQVHGTAYPNQFWQQGRPVVVAMFHGQLLLSPFIYPRKITANALEDYLKRHPETEEIINKQRKIKFLTTDLSDKFRVLGSKFFGKKILPEKIELI